MQRNRKQHKKLKCQARQVQMVIFDFDGVFTDNRVIILQGGKEAVFCSRSDGFGLQQLRALSIPMLVISTETNPVVGERCKKMDIRYIQGCGDKTDVLMKEAAKLRIPLKHIAYLGNDVNDRACLEKVGFAACVADAHPAIVKICSYKTKFPGGYGAVREFCDFITEAKK